MAAAAAGEERQMLAQRLKAAVHYTVGCLCEEVEEDKDVQFSKQCIAAISDITFRQCEIFAKDLEMFARHAKRTTVTTEDVKLLARRSNSLIEVRNSLSLPRGAESPNINTGITESLYSFAALYDAHWIKLTRLLRQILKYITQKSEELASNNMEQKEKKKKKSSTAKGERIPGEQEAVVTENEDSNMA